ncbi:MAG: peptidoglycan-binding protein [Acidimicrobiales bacterium]
MADLQRRLAEVGTPSPQEEYGSYGPGTEEAVRSFQAKRGLRIDGICGRQTWGGLVEAGFRLGDRLLYLTTPMQRGDDIAALQRHLGALGFDAGRVDGIFGDRTQRALMDFQRNAGLTVDATCGPATILAIERLGGRAASADHVARVREREELRRGPGTLRDRRVAVGEPGGLGALARAVAHALQEAGAQVVTLHAAEGSDQAAQANGADAEVYLGLAPADDGCLTAYYSGHGYESAGGRRLAECLQVEIAPLLGRTVAEPEGMALPVLRETRMPAVLCELGPPSALVSRSQAIALACRRGVACWAETLPEL